MIRLLSTDFDGTLVDHFASPSVSPALFETLLELRRCGVLWAVNTGRGLDLILDGLRQFEFPLEPDYILTNEREVFHRNSAGQWQDYGDWNQRCAQAHESLFQREGTLVAEVVRFLQDETSGEAIYDNDRAIGLITKTDEEMDRLVKFLLTARKRDSLFHYQRNSIYLRFCHADYSKGAALGELCRLTGVSNDETFTAGDHHNDLSMLDGRFARWPAAPSNAIDEVKTIVQNAGGYVANARCGDGVVEALLHFFRQHHLAPPQFQNV